MQPDPRRFSRRPVPAPDPGSPPRRSPRCCSPAARRAISARSWQCPLAEGGLCDSVAAADPAVPDPAATRATVLAEPLWRVRADERAGPAPDTAPPCEAGCGAFDPFAWLARLFAAEAHEDEARSGWRLRSGGRRAGGGPPRSPRRRSRKPKRPPPRGPGNRTQPPFRPKPKRSARTARRPRIFAPARSSRGSGSRPSSTRTASTARRATSGSCWSPPAGGSADGIGRAVAAAGAVRGPGGAGRVDAAGAAGRAPCPAALARLRRIERALRQRGLGTGSSSSCRRLPASTPRPWGRSRARWPTPRPSAAPSR